MRKRNDRRRFRTWPLGAMAAFALLVSACTLPTSPAPVVADQPEGRGIVEGVEVAPSEACLVSIDAADAPPPGLSNLSIESGGVTRSAILRVPQGDGPHPVLVSLHAFTQSPDQWELYSGLADAALARGYVVASPLGSQPGPRWAVPGGLELGADDVGFIADLLDRIEDRVCVDRNAEFAAGYSAGAAMAQALSCTMPWRFTAVAGSGGMNLTETCPGSPPTDVMTLHGTADPIAPPGGSYVVFSPPLGLPIQTVASTNAARAGCDPTAVESTPVDSVLASTWGGCDDSHRVTHWQMLGAGHTWAGADSLANDLVTGTTLDTFSATEVVLDFFDAA